METWIQTFCYCGFNFYNTEMVHSNQLAVLLFVFEISIVIPFSWNIVDASIWANHQLKLCFCKFWTFENMKRFSLALFSICITSNMFSHQNWILRNFIIHPYVTHSSIAFASENEFLRNDTMYCWQFLLFETKKQENGSSKLKMQ